MGSFNHCESIYWVFTQLCNDKCDHCYNLSGPDGARISIEECLQIVANLPEKVDRLILSGGEPLADKNKLFIILDALREKYHDATQIMLQTNGDLMTGALLDILLEKGVSRIDIASIDRYHKKKGERIDWLRDLFVSRGMHDDNTKPLIEKDTYLNKNKSFGFWGASEDMWLGGNWARGRAMEKDIWYKNPEHNFCAILSGAIGFLGGVESIPQEISIQLWKINPCCPGTYYPLGDARTENDRGLQGAFDPHVYRQRPPAGGGAGQWRADGLVCNHRPADRQCAQRAKSRHECARKVTAFFILQPAAD